MVSVFAKKNKGNPLKTVSKHEIDTNTVCAAPVGAPATNEARIGPARTPGSTGSIVVVFAACLA